ncbi:MAG: hypothetical protein AB8G05_27150 [Oligoflexales bacterium]
MSNIVGFILISILGSEISLVEITDIQSNSEANLYQDYAEEFENSPFGCEGRALLFESEISSASKISGVEREFFVGLSEDPIFRDYSDEDFKFNDEREFALPIKGENMDIDKTLLTIASTLESNPYLAETFNSSLLFHGATSASLLAFTEYSQGKNDLIPTGILLEQGRVPFSGQIFWHIKDNKDHLSTVIIYHLETTFRYAGIDPSEYTWEIGDGWTIDSAETKLSKVVGLYCCGPAFFLENYKLVHEKRKSEWRKLNYSEKDLVKANFPVIFGLRPSNLESYDQYANSLVEGEIVVKNGVTNRDIKVVYVPEDYLILTQHILSKTAAHVNRVV